MGEYFGFKGDTFMKFSKERKRETTWDNTAKLDQPRPDMTVPMYPGTALETVAFRLM